MIRSFRDNRTERIFQGVKVKRLESSLFKRARRRLEFLNAATKLEDLAFPPSNHLHKLKGFKPERYAIRVNDQWRVTFVWQNGCAFDVFFEDYHK